MIMDLSKVFEINLGHTPGYYYAFAYVVSALVFLSVVERPRLKLKCVITTVVFYLCVTAIMVVTSGAVGWTFAVAMVVIFGMICLYFLLAGDLTWKKAIYFASRSFIVAEFAAAFYWQLYRFCVVNFHVPAETWPSVAFMAGVYAFVFTITYLIERRYRAFNVEFEPEGKMVGAVILLSTFVFVLSNLSFSALNTPFSGTSDAEIFAIRTLADFSGVGILLAFHTQITAVAVRFEREKLAALLHMQEESYRISAESIEVVNRKYHDLKYQIALLKTDLPQEEKAVFLNEMEQEISAYEARNKTGNETLNILLSAKTLQCQKENITLTCVADGKELGFMSASDISVLFGNAIDNAIEGASKIDSPEKRLIHLTVAAQKAFLHIRVENYCEDKLTFRDGLPVTTKSDSAFHGFGVKSMRAIAEKYGGTLTTTLKDGWFELRILIPIPRTAAK